MIERKDNGDGTTTVSILNSKVYRRQHRILPTGEVEAFVRMVERAEKTVNRAKPVRDPRRSS